MRVYLRGRRWWAYFSIRAADGSKLPLRVSIGLREGEATETQARRRAEEIREERTAEALASRLGIVPVEPEPAAPVCIFSGLAKRWLERKRTEGLAAGSIQKYAHEIKQHLLPTFGNIDATTITKGQVIILQEQLVARYGTGTVNSAIGRLAQILAYGVDLGYLSDNPARRVRKLKKRAGEDGAWDWYTVDELDALREAAKRWAPVHTLITVAAYTGLRVGELRGLEWGDVDFKSRTLHIQRQVQRGRIDLPKWGKTRTVPMRAVVLDALKAHRHLRSEVVFPGYRADRFAVNWLRGELHRCAALAGLRAVRVHDLRHTFASQLVSQGVSLKMVAELLGHRSTTTTERYAHLAPTATAELFDRLDREEAHARKVRAADKQEQGG